MPRAALAGPLIPCGPLNRGVSLPTTLGEALIARRGRELRTAQADDERVSVEENLDDGMATAESINDEAVSDFLIADSDTVAGLHFDDGWDMFSDEQRGDLLDELERVARSARPSARQLGSLRA